MNNLGLDIVGIGFEYTFATTKWQMIKYAKGLPVEKLREELLSIADGIPDMIAAQHSLFQHINNYLGGNFFPSE
jgi:hypothetical protein